jgi:(1->4)-alpha-D-glucan 1-alpha-D-glucosylmutase
MLRELDAGGPAVPAHPTRSDDSGAAKLHLVTTVLRLRRDRPDLFAGYAPVTATGPAEQHVVAFDRGGVLTVATRLPATLARAGGWQDTRLDLPPGRYRDALTGRPADADLASLLAQLPVALLVKES